MLIAKPLDRVQGSRVNLSDDVMSWHDLAQELNELLPTDNYHKYIHCRKVALAAVHLLSFSFTGSKVSYIKFAYRDEGKEALEYASECS